MRPRFRLVPAAILALAGFGTVWAQDAKAISEKLTALREAAADRDLPQAEKLFAEFEALGPGDDGHDEARVLLGKTRMIGGRYPEAAAIVQPAVDRETSPWAVKALYLTAEAGARRRDFGLAADIYAKRVDWSTSDLHKAEIASLYREIADGDNDDNNDDDDDNDDDNNNNDDDDDASQHEQHEQHE